MVEHESHLISVAIDARESLAIHVGQRVRGQVVVEVVERISDHHGLPKAIRVDSPVSHGMSQMSIGS